MVLCLNFHRWHFKQRRYKATEHQKLSNHGLCCHLWKYLLNFYKPGLNSRVSTMVMRQDWPICLSVEKATMLPEYEKLQVLTADFVSMRFNILPVSTSHSLKRRTQLENKIHHLDKLKCVLCWTNLLPAYVYFTRKTLNHVNMTNSNRQTIKL